MQNINWTLEEKPSVFLLKMLENIKNDPAETKNNRDGLSITVGKVLGLEALSDVYRGDG